MKENPSCLAASGVLFAVEGVAGSKFAESTLKLPLQTSWRVQPKRPNPLTPKLEQVGAKQIHQISFFQLQVHSGTI